MASESFEVEFPRWKVTWDVVRTWNTFDWRDNADCWQDLELTKFDSLLQISHKKFGFVIDVEWNDTQNDDGMSFPNRGYRVGPTKTGKFIVQVIRDSDWDKPMERYEYGETETINMTIRELLVRYA